MFEFKVGDRVTLTFVNGEHEVKANVGINRELYPLSVSDISFTRFGEYRKDSGEVHLSLVKESQPKRVEVTSVLHPLDLTEVSESQLETFTKGSESSVEQLMEDLTTLPIRCQVVEGGKLPTYAHDGDAGMDLYVREVEALENNLYKYQLGIKLDLEEGYAAFIYPRSSAYKTAHLMTNCVGVIDSGYKGEISAVMACRTPYEVGDRACQMVIMPVPKVKLIEVKELRDSSRGSNGYGSTGK